MSSTQTQTQLCTVTPMSSCVQCHISFRQFSSSVATFIFIKIFVEYSHECTGRNGYIWYSPLKDFLEVSIESWSEWGLSLETHMRQF